MADYEFLTEHTVADYIRQNRELSARIDPDHLASIREVGDGNLNLVFLATDEAGRGMCLKQALPYVRMTGEGWPMTPDRARHEVESLQAHHQLTPELLPEVYLYDPSRYIIAMEDLSDHQVWRGSLIAGERKEGAAEAVGTYVGALAFGTSAFAMEREALAEAVARAVNAQLCTITEDLVFTEPVAGAERNSFLAANAPDVAEFQADPAVWQGMGYAKWIFMTKAEALIHGDLHTGSVMVRSAAGSDVCDSVKAFDSEFAFYGPLAFDLGALFANYVVAAARAVALGEDDRAHWCLRLIEQTWTGFEAEFRRRWPTRRDPRVWGDEFLDELLATWRSEAWLFAAAKMSRRIIGAAKTRDIESLPENLREGAARGVLRVSRRLLVERHLDSSPARFVALAEPILRDARTV
ncbi:MAG: S-methyl-5-thioribose kinase [Actinobacteria bacterium HGW-Actinobacteria-2]|nr:MAG: S-methyl-5-thioribose kinase [Actinobacteria bacterium HGW-Actinobacteria-2]